MTSDTRPFAIVTGASAGIGYELAKCCAEQGFDLLVAADELVIFNRDQHLVGMVLRGDLEVHTGDVR
jgi:short-subunit dehydrogenase